MKLEVIIFIFLMSLVNGCPDKENIHPCECETKDSSFYITCIGLTNEQDFIQAIKPFSNLSDIVIFSIGNSSIKFIPSNAFKKLKFEGLIIYNSTLMALTDTDLAFSGLEDYLGLIMVMNTTLIHDWDWSVFRNLKGLTVLSISDTHVGYVERIELLHVDKLEMVTLVRDQISSIDDRAFDKCKNLNALDLGYNHITFMKRSMLPNPANRLWHLSLASNNIELFPIDMFTNMPVLKELDLSENKLITLDVKTLDPVWPKLFQFKANGNKLICDCRIDWILKKSPPSNLQATCFEPTFLKGKHISSLDSEDLIC